MNMEQLNEIRNKRNGTLTDAEVVEQTHDMYGNSRDNLAEVIEVMELLNLDISKGDKLAKAIKHGISKTRAIKALDIKKSDEDIYLKYVKYSSSTDWNEFCLKQLGEL